ncbi:hypothetical protein BDQ94DRAFT_141439 [Aspergillus welwitschiae]|uniref:Uncharacterized protein n=1 Tax=Aspergillus welwitschiae TaxID=1341132 RepID=A0A3F3Q5U4_9EURO|nr:hypothetical protein BDQ94DRAFT_141439 [Aspergillus welwitschiae]RDH34417.1 hypothetical protein BDQ94DRAFT_141439 [Aspergillus welwitschiae]
MRFSSFPSSLWISEIELIKGRSKGLIWNPREESRILGWAFLGSGPLPVSIQR